MNWNQDVSYDYEAKKKLHRVAKSRLKQLAALLDLPEGSYDLRICKGGPAVSGEITLHHDRIYIQVSQASWPGGILIRTCKSRKDYTGGPNHFKSLAMLDQLPALAAYCRGPQLLGHLVQNP